MRINVYAEELLDQNDARSVERMQITTAGGRTFYGARFYLKSSIALHDTLEDDDRSAVTIWGPRAQVARLLRDLADTMEGNQRAK